MPLLLLFLFPFLFFLFLIPFKFTIDSLITLLYAPQQIWRIAANQNLSQNHALEHATINVLEEKYGYNNLSGLAKETGFQISGQFDPYIVEEAAQEGLWRLQQGESDLVIHKRCGSSMVVANVVSALAFFVLLFMTKAFSLLNVMLALLLARVFGPRLGVWVQKNFTTSADVENMEIVGVDLTKYSNSFFAQMGSQQVFVRTRELNVYGG
jgi:uncharacterized protein YqhQ